MQYTKFELEQLENLVSEGYLRKSVKGPLTLYGYTDKCTFDRHWTPLTRQARGLIIESETGKVVALPLPKFFNLGEMEETLLHNLPQEQPEVFEKVDGSLGIVFHHNGEWQVSTRGSFYSEQAVKAKELLTKYNLRDLSENLTLLVEIIYPSNKIIVDYGSQEKLVLLAVNNRERGFGLCSRDMMMLAWCIEMESAKRYDLTVPQMIELQKSIPKDQEGFVLKYSNGLRVKIKGDEYLRIAKLMSSLSPISCWEVMKNGKVDTFYLQQLPEEFKKDFEPIVVALENQYSKIVSEIAEDLNKLPTNGSTPKDRKILGLFLNTNNNVKHKSAMFPAILGKRDQIDKYIMKTIRPNGNEMSYL